MKLLRLLAFALVCLLAAFFASPAARAANTFANTAPPTPGKKTGAGGNELLSQRLAGEFPSLKGNLTARDVSYEKVQRTLAGGEVSGLLTRGAVTRAPAGAADAGPGLKPEEAAALRSLAERESNGSAFEAFFPSRYNEPFAVEGGGMSAVLRPLGAQPAAAQNENGQIVYRDAYPETDSLHVVGAGRSEEFLYLRNEGAPRRFEYELSDVTGAREVTLEGGAIQFAGGHHRLAPCRRPRRSFARGRVVPLPGRRGPR